MSVPTFVAAAVAQIQRFDRRIAIAGLVGLLIIGTLVHVASWRGDAELTKQDIFYIWLEGHRIVEGENPYARVLVGDMSRNNKYATYFPLSYVLSAAPQLLGFADFPEWIAMWHATSLVLTLSITVLLFAALFKRVSPIAALVGAAFWLLNRWSLIVSSVAHVDPLPIALLLVGMLLLETRPRLACITFGVSLAVKQVAIFLLPLFLVQVWLSAEERPWRHVGRAIMSILAVPVIVSIPFFLWGPEGFIKSIVFSATRNPDTNLGAPSFDAVVAGRLWSAFGGLPARVPMLLLMTLICVVVLRRNVGFFLAALLIMVTFVDFNSVLFRQYMAWVAALVPLAMCDFGKSRSADRSTLRPDAFTTQGGG
ncbi:MAG TPA: hypothetical protein VFB99_10600 [Vicinamibacterales bacterium]|nr:hypothetical protein [Vicinamibacterales bacterium]